MLQAEGKMISSRPSDRSGDLPESPPRRRLTWKVAWAGAAIFIALAGILAIVFPTQFKHQFAISVTRQPTPYTQLFFANSTTLPRELSLNRPNDVKFTVVNNEGRAATYHYTVTMAVGNQAKIAGQGSFALGDNQSITQTAVIKPSSRRSQYLVKITLDGTGSFIQFYASTP
jgi:hypothetical protein